MLVTKLKLKILFRTFRYESCFNIDDAVIAIKSFSLNTKNHIIKGREVAPALPYSEVKAIMEMPGAVVLIIVRHPFTRSRYCSGCKTISGALATNRHSFKLVCAIILSGSFPLSETNWNGKLQETDILKGEFGKAMHCDRKTNFEL